jgi:hypothetical protein
MTHAIPAPARYALGRHVFLCICGQDFVLLDLARDKYLALEVPHTAGLSTLVRGWPTVSSVPTPAAGAEESASIATALLDRGLLTLDVAAGKDATPVELPTPTEELTADVFGERPSARAGEMLFFVAACLRGRYLRQHSSIEYIVERARRRKEKAGFVAHEFDVGTAQRLLATFGSMRNVFLSTRNLCLLEAIVLLEFFSYYGLYPTWVFGVQARPFAAHCWLQHEELVLNDTIDHVTRYTPIMTI